MNETAGSTTAGAKASTRRIAFGDCRFDALVDGDEFVGLGEISIGGTLVRSGRLPLRPAIQTFTGLEISRLRLLDIEQSETRARVCLECSFRPMLTGLMRDHSFDPIHDTSDWDRERTSGKARLDLVLERAADSFGGVAFDGFSYHYEYKSDDVPIFWILDRASWELDGDIGGATAISQSSCSAPAATFEPDTAWSTEGVIHWEDNASKANPVMTHNLPRWASHQAFDFQYKGDRTLIGVFDRVTLVRTLLKREAGRAELKTFDKHIFDQALEHATIAKAVLLNRDAKGEVAQKNVWTWVMDEVHRRARAEFGLAEEPMIPWVSQNYWEGFDLGSYSKDLLPASAAIGAKAIFIDNVHKNAMTEDCPNPGKFHWNMCCGHEYEVAPRLGGPAKLKELIERCDELGIQVFSWTNNTQALSSPLNDSERDEERQWYVKMECTRMKYGGAYTNVFSVWDFKSEGARRNWIESLKRTKEQTGLAGYLFDSFYNLGFMPINYSNCTPTTMWREMLLAAKELQDAEIHFKIESFGPFGCVMHGCPTSYDIDNIFACYKIGLGSGYTTVPSGGDLKATLPSEASVLYYVLAHMTNPGLKLFVDDKRIDALWTDDHKRALHDYNENHAHMARRYLQEDGNSVVWHDREGRRATVWNFADRTVSLPGSVRDLSSGEELARGEAYDLQACHAYSIEDAEPLPTEIAAVTSAGARA